ncbi:MAG TPA: ATP-binding protein [Candidatus Binatia bacterium]|nr:ATP-binding protein [Candidatus Binatia bacterium]
MLREHDPRYLAVARLAGLANLLLGSVVLAGWLLGIERLSDLSYDGITMKANAALALALSGAALLALLPPDVSTARRIGGQMLAVSVFVLGALTLIEHVVGWDLGIDQLIAVEPPGEKATVSPGRMGPPASSSFTLLGIALLFLHTSLPRAVQARETIGFAIAALTLLSLVGNLNGAAQLYSIAHFTGISRQTALALFVQAVGLLCARPNQGEMQVFTSPLSGGAFLRRLLLPAIVAPAALGWLCVQAMEHEVFDAPFGLALLAVTLTALLVTVAARNGRMLDAINRERLAAAQEREQLLDSERQARTEMERSARMKDEFLATLSHELRTPLSAILGWSYVLASKVDDAETLHKGVEVIERNARHQSQLIEDLLDMSRISSGKMLLDMQRVDFPAVVEAAVQAVRPAAEKAGIGIDTVFEWDGSKLFGDPTRLQQVVWNLLTNAVKFTSSGGRISVKLERSDHQATLYVTDTGQGIAAEFLPHVFDRFRQANASITRQHGGLGIGLSIVKQIVEMHGGQVTVRSDGTDCGSCFQVDLPLALPASEEETAAAASPNFEIGAADSRLPELSGIRALVVDDEADARDMLSRLLSDRGAAVVCAGDAEQALTLLRSQQFDVFVSDIGMPVKNGYELMRDVREHGLQIPAIALTAYAGADDRLRALEAGFQCHVAKPVEASKLLATISSLL